MDKNLFQNDHITGNSKVGFEFRGQFKDDENVLLTKLKEILNRDISFSNINLLFKYSLELYSLNIFSNIESCSINLLSCSSILFYIINNSFW